MKTQKVLTTIPVTAPDGIAITPDGRKVYVSSADTGTVQVIETSTDTIVGSIAVGAQPQGLSIALDGARLVVAVQGDGKVVLIDTATDAIVSQAQVGKAHASCTSADGKLAYLASQVTSAPAVVVVDLATGNLSATYSVDKPPRALGLAPWGKLYFSAVGSDALEVMDPASGSVSASIPTGGSPHDTRPSLDGKTELVISQTAGDLELIDPGTESVVAKVPTGKTPHWMALSADGHLAYVTNEGDDDVVVVDLAARAVVQTIAIGKAPRKIVLQQ